MTAFPPRLPDQPIFYPVTTEAYAVKIARDWNVRDSGHGFVTRFVVRKAYPDAYNVEEAGGRAQLAVAPFLSGRHLRNPFDHFWKLVSATELAAGGTSHRAAMVRQCFRPRRALYVFG